MSYNVNVIDRKYFQKLKRSYIMKKLSALIICILALLLFTACNGSSSVDEGGKDGKSCQDGHTFELSDESKKATCTEGGELVYVCSVCKERKTEAVDALGHNEVTEAAVAATCTEDGKTEKKYCSNCGTVTVESQTIPAGHVLGEMIADSVVVPSERWSGVVYFPCSVCQSDVGYELPVITDPCYTVSKQEYSDKYVCTIAGKAVEFSVSHFVFEKNPNFQYVLIGYRGDRAELNLPATYNGEPVRGIADNAFKGNKTITSVTIPEGYFTIGSYAFENCSSLKSVSIPEGVYKISERAFANSGLLSVTIPASVENIESYAFSRCTKLTEVKSVAGSEMYQISHHAFDCCTSLKSLSLDGNMETGVLFGCTALESLTIYYPGASSRSGLGRLFVSAGISPGDNSAVPASLKTVTITGTGSINSDAFKGCSSIEKIVLENSEYIGENCFEGCTSLKELHVVSTGNIGRNALSSCPSLETLIIENVGSIENRAFANCQNLTNLTVGKVKSFNPSALEGCTSLQKAELDGGIYVGNGNSILLGISTDAPADFEIKDGTVIVLATFTENSIEKLTIPASVKCISGTFLSGISDVIYGGKLGDWVEISFLNAESNPLSIAGTITFSDNTTNHSVTFLRAPDNYDQIYASSFLGFSSLKTIVVPKSVYYIHSLPDSVLNVYYEGTEDEWRFVHNPTNALDGRTVYYYSEAELTIEDYLRNPANLWHYNAQNQPEAWVLIGNIVDGKSYKYNGNTEVVISETFWQMILWVREDESMMEELFDVIFEDLNLSPEDKAYVKDMIRNTEDKYVFADALRQFHKKQGENFEVSFADGKMTLALDGPSATFDYIEVNGCIYYRPTPYGLYQMFFTIDGDTIFEHHVTDDGTVIKHIYELQ